MANVNLSLPESMSAPLEEQVAEGGYDSANQYVQELILEAQRRGPKHRHKAARGGQRLDRGESITAGEGESPERSPSDALRTLQSDVLSPAERRYLVIEAEVLAFDATLKSQLVAVLRDYVERFRDSQDPADLVAVGSAVRKLVANLPADDLASAVALLDAGHRAAPSLEVELEVAKALVRKLAAHPAADAGQCAGLSDGLRDLAWTYLQDRLLPREKHAAVALNASLALLLLPGDHGPELLARLRGLKQTWFTELLARRAARLRDDLVRRSPAEAKGRSVAALDDVARLFANPRP